MMQRRGFLKGLGAFLAAPAIVRASSLMPVRALLEVPEEAVGIVTGESLYAQLTAVTRRAFAPRLYADLFVADPLLARLSREVPV